MNKLFITLLFVLIHQLSYAQTPEVDSLLHAVTTDIPEEKKVDALNQVAFKYLGFDSVNTARFANQAIELATKINYKEGICDAYYSIGWVTMVFGHNAKAIELFNKVLETAQQAKYIKGEANANNGLGDANRNIGNYPEALEHHLKALKLREDLGDKNRVASSLNNIGIIYYVRGDYDKALEYYSKGLEIRKETGDQRQIAVSYNNIGIVYVAKGRYQEALDYYQKCVEINQSLGDKTDVARNYSNIGVVYTDHLKEPKQGLEYYLKALSVYEELGDKASMTYPLMGIGAAYSELGDLAKARTYLKQAIKLSQEAQLFSNVKDGFKILVDIERKSGHYKEAFEAHVRFKSLSDSLINEEQTKKLATLEAEHKFQKEKDVIENEKLAITKELERKRIVQYVAISGIVVLLMLLFIVYRFYHVKKESNKILIAKNEEIQRQRDELVKLNNTKTRFFSIISHDLRSPINTFFGMFGLIKMHLNEKYQADKDDDLNQMMDHLKNAGDQLTTLLDNLITWALKEEGTMPINPERLDIYKCVEENIAILEPNALAKDIALEANVDRGIHAWADKNSLMTILRNLTSNALKFTSPGGTITLSASKSDDKVMIAVQDTGVGIEQEKLEHLFDVSEKKVTRGTKGEKGTGLGLNLVYDFVKINDGSIQVSSEVGTGTTFEIELPVA